MKNSIPSKDELNNDETLYRHADVEPKLEWLNESPFELDKIQIAFIKTTFEADRKTKLFVQDPDIFNEFILSINALIRKYHSIKNRSKDFNQESESIAKIGDWLKDLNQAKKALIQIDNSEQIAPLLQMFLTTELHLHSQKQAAEPFVIPRSLVEMSQDFSYVINKLEQSVKAMQPHVKSGRPKVDDMRARFILELAEIYEATFNQYPSSTQSNPFDHLVGHLLEIVGDPVEDSIGAIKKTFKSK
jgi:hypothetical protein